MSPTITTSSEANGNVSAATARAAAKAAVVAEQTGPQPITLAKALNTAMADAMHADPSVLVFGEDVGMLGGVFRITDGLTKTFGKDRCFDTPLAESGIVGMAVGMAMNGMRPVIEMQFDAFAYPAFEQIVSHVAKMHNRTKGAVKLPMVIRVPYAGGIGGVEHHCDSSEAYYAHTAGLKVFTPATVADGYRMLREAIDSDDPVMFMEPKKLYWSKDQVDLDALRAEHAENTARGTSSEGRAAVARPGTDATLIAYGPVRPDGARRRRGGRRGGTLARGDRRPLDRALRRRDGLRLGPQDRPRRGHRRGPRLRVRGLRDRRAGPGTLFPPPGRADPPCHGLRRPVPGAQARALLPARRGPHPRRR